MCGFEAENSLAIKEHVMIDHEDWQTELSEPALRDNKVPTYVREAKCFFWNSRV